MAEPAKKQDGIIVETESELQQKAPKESRTHLKLLKSTDMDSPKNPLMEAKAPSEELMVAGFWVRGMAYLVDIFIVNVTSFMIFFTITFFMNLGLLKQQNFDYSSIPQNTNIISTILFFLIPTVLSFFYYGWFYKNKGGSPGKLALGLVVVDSSSKGNLGYGKTFIREKIVKPISGLLLFTGYLMCLFSDERVTLHDLICKTRVYVRK